MDQLDTYNLADWVPSIEQVTLNVRSTNGNSDAAFTSYLLPEAQRKKLGKEYFGDGKALTHITWELYLRGLQNATNTSVTPNVAAVAPSPKRTDEITDANGVVYVIDSIPESKQFGNVWVCFCKITTPVVDAQGG